jgi:glycosyltransferase involved in cell wall biosynthesis
VNGLGTILLSTLPLEYEKGVATHTRHVLSVLQRSGFQATVAYYQPYSMAPELSVPCWHLGRRTVRNRIRSVGGITAQELGCWLPELEFTNYWPTRSWKELIDRHDYLLTVSGNPLAATPFAFSGKPFLAWLGTPFAPDRQDRIKTFPLARRLADRALNSRLCRRYERKVLNSGLILPTTSYVAREFLAIAPRAQVLSPVPVPIDTAFFTPGGPVDEGSVMFTGKYNDPRKNIRFLLEVVRALRNRAVAAVLHLYGDRPSAAVLEHIGALGLQDAVLGLCKLTREELRTMYRRSTVFVVPSFQEGLCVAGLEAMACGCPVVTSPCGGPEDYVRDGINGYVAPLETEMFVAAILKILESRDERARLSREAQATIQRRFTSEVVEPDFLAALGLLTDSSRSRPRRNFAAAEVTAI